MCGTICTACLPEMNMTPTSERGAQNRGRVASDPMLKSEIFADRRHADNGIRIPLKVKVLALEMPIVFASFRRFANLCARGLY